MANKQTSPPRKGQALDVSQSFPISAASTSSAPLQPRKLHSAVPKTPNNRNTCILWLGRRFKKEIPKSWYRPCGMDALSPAASPSSQPHDAASLRFCPLLQEKEPDFPLSGLSMNQFSYAGVETNLSEEDTCTCSRVLLQLAEVCVLSTLLLP